MPEDRRVLQEPGPSALDMHALGPHPDQVIDCYPAADPSGRPTVVLVHGGYWRPEYDRAHARWAAAGLATAGYPTALVEYRRIAGDPDVTVADVRAALEAVAAGRTTLPAGRVVLVGHSAGGHLALVVGAGHPQVAGILALAPVADLRLAQEQELDGDAVRAFLGGTAADRPDLDPAACGPVPATTVVVQGSADSLVPPEVAASWSRATGGRVVTVLDVGHFELIDPQSRAWPIVIAELEGITASAGIE